MTELKKTKQETELEKAKQEYDFFIKFAERWLRTYKETNEEIFKSGFKLHMKQALLCAELWDIELDSRYLEMQAEWETLK